MVQAAQREAKGGAAQLAAQPMHLQQLKAKKKAAPTSYFKAVCLGVQWCANMLCACQRGGNLRVILAVSATLTTESPQHAHMHSPIR